jgi:ribosomal protein L40E
MKICNACGRQLPDQVKFCNKCGASVAPASAETQHPSQDSSISCAKCGATYPAGTKFCRKDGTPLMASPIVSGIDKSETEMQISEKTELAISKETATVPPGVSIAAAGLPTDANSSEPATEEPIVKTADAEKPIPEPLSSELMISAAPDSIPEETIDKTTDSGAPIAAADTSEPVISAEPAQDSSITCPKCGALYPAGSKFCRKDGALLCGMSAPQTAAAVDSEEASVEAAAVIKQQAATPTAPVAEEPAAAIQEPPDKPKSGKLVLWSIVIVVLLAASTAGGYFLYTKFMIKNMPAANDQSVAISQPAPAHIRPTEAPPAQAPVNTSPPQIVTSPSASSAPAEAKPGPAATVPAPQQTQVDHAQPITTSLPMAGVRIKASAMINDVRDNKPYGFGTQFQFGASRITHYVYYDNAIPNQTILSSRYYKDGAFLFACQNRAVQYSLGRYYCRPSANLAPGNYEVKFGIDGVETQTLKFSVN